jgi:hypothetical protein
MRKYVMKIIGVPRFTGQETGFPPVSIFCVILRMNGGATRDWTLRMWQKIFTRTMKVQVIDREEKSFHELDAYFSGSE